MSDKDKDIVLEMLMKKIDELGERVDRRFDSNDSSHVELFRQINGVRVEVSESLNHTHPHCEECSIVSTSLNNLSDSVDDRFRVRDTVTKYILMILVASGILSQIFLK